MEQVQEKSSLAERQIISSRLIHAPAKTVFNAFADPSLLAQWWRPKGFTNTFHEFDFRPGGQWKFIMHGPNGKEFPNESKFVEIREAETIVFRHISDPKFQMTIGFEAIGNDTRFSFQMLFETADVCNQVKQYVPQANEQNFDRLEAVLQKQQAKPSNMTNVNAYLNFDGNCRDAMTFYKESLGGELMMQPVKETPMAAQCPQGMQDHIMHSSLTGDGFLLMASDMFSGGTYQPGNNFSLTVNCSSEEHIRSLFDKLADGGSVFQPLQQQFWGAMFGMLTDKFGTRWMLNYETPKQA